MKVENRPLGPDPGESRTGAIRYLRLPGRDLFATRAGRFRQLSAGHPLGDYLAFLARLAEAQQDALDRLPSVSLPGHAKPAACRGHGMPLLGVGSLSRDPAWRESLMAILRQMKATPLPQAASETVEALLLASADSLEQTAERILSGNLAGVAPGEYPFVASALQVYWVNLASTMEEQAFSRPELEGVCPVCGSFPVAGIVRAGGAEQGLRYLCCSLCAAQWHMVRVRCSTCGSTSGVGYYSLEGANGAVKAESCADCGAYLKLLYLEKEARMEATADDLATIALDMLMEKEGRMRAGLNLYLHPGGV